MLRWKRDRRTLWTLGELAIELEGARYAVYRGRTLLTAPFSSLFAAKRFAEGVAQRDEVQP